MMATYQPPEKRRITVSYGRTYNLGNFESLRIDVSEEYDVTGTPYGIQAEEMHAYGRLRDLVELRIRQMTDGVSGETDPRTPTVEAQAASPPPLPPAPPRADAGFYAATPTATAHAAVTSPHAAPNPHAIVKKKLDAHELDKRQYASLCGLIRESTRMSRQETLTKKIQPEKMMGKIPADILLEWLILERLI